MKNKRLLLPLPPPWAQSIHISHHNNAFAGYARCVCPILGWFFILFSISKEKTHFESDLHSFYSRICGLRMPCSTAVVRLTEMEWLEWYGYANGMEWYDGIHLSWWLCYEWKCVMDTCKQSMYIRIIITSSDEWIGWIGMGKTYCAHTSNLFSFHFYMFNCNNRWQHNMISTAMRYFPGIEPADERGLRDAKQWNCKTFCWTWDWKWSVCFIV